MSGPVTPPPPAPPPSGGVPAQAAVTVQEAPPALRGLPPGSEVPVRVEVPPIAGMMEVSSPFGRLTLQTPLPLPKGADLLLHLTGAHRERAVLRIAAIDGKPLTQALAAPIATLSRGPAITAPLPTPQPDTDTARPGPAVTIGNAVRAVPGTRLAATVLHPGAAQPPTTGSTTPTQGVPKLEFPAGTRLTLRLTAIQSPPPGAPAAAAPASPTPPASGGTSPHPPTGGAPLTPSASQAAPAPQAASPAVTTAPPPAQATLTGLVAGNSDAGRPLLRTDAGLLALDTAAQLPKGAHVTVRILAQQPPPSTPPTPTPPALPALSLSAGAAGGSAWPALGETLEVLSQTDAQAAQSLRRAIPAPDGRMMTNSVAFAQAARSGDLRQWPGERTLRALAEAGPRGRALAQRLGEDMQEIAGRAREGSGDWRVLHLPVATGATIDRIAIITRREGRDTDDDGPRRKDEDQGTRFLVNLDLSRLGAMQLDGLYAGEQKRLNLVVRTVARLDPAVRRDIHAIFAQNAAALGLDGAVTFQVTKRFEGPADGPAARPGGDGPGLLV